MHLTAFFDLVLHAIEGAANSLPAAWLTLSQSAAAQVITAAWQGAAVALGLAICLRLAPTSPARHRFALWAAGFGTLVGLQLFPLIAPLLPTHLSGAPVAAAAVGAAQSVSHPWLQLQLNAAWSIVIASLWLAALLYRAADLALHSFHLRKLWKTAVPVEPAASAPLLSSLRVEGRGTIQICTTHELERPSVIGFIAPRILIPDWLFARLTPGELEQIVLHETEHLRRRDDWTNLLQKLCLVLFPLNPGLAWIERRLCREREMACDDGVIRITRAPRAYAACLTSLAERGLQRRTGALSLGAWSRRPELVHRVHSILRHKHALSPAAARALMGALGCGLLFGAVALARCPRLIAFVPAHKASAPAVLAAHASAQSAPALPVAANVAANARVMDASARMAAPRRPVVKTIPLHASVRHAAPRPVRTSAWGASFAPEARPVATKALEGTDAAKTGESLIVVTTWERVQMTGSLNAQLAGVAPGSEPGMIRATRARTPRVGNELTHQIMVTRMFLRIYPAGSVVSRDGVATGYAGWLVIQL